MSNRHERRREAALSRYSASAETEALIAAVRHDEYNRITQWLNEVYQPRQREMETFEAVLLQTIARIDEWIQAAKGMRRDLLTARIEGLTVDLGAQSVAYRNLMIKNGVQTNYIDAVTAMVSAAQDAAALALDGNMDRALSVITEARTLQPQNSHPITMINLGGRPATGPGPIQKFILDSVRQIWAESGESFSWSVNHFYGQLVERYQNNGCTDDERKALDKLNDTKAGIEAYVENLHKTYPPQIGGG
jgi:AcrR family transcriptional regulator